jgi:sulfur dioxygenase
MAASSVSAGGEIRVLHAPGHAAGSVSYACRGKVFTGAALLIDGCRRTGFQNGSADALHGSVNGKLFTPPDHALMWPGHYYKEPSGVDDCWEKFITHA